MVPDQAPVDVAEEVVVVVVVVVAADVVVAFSSDTFTFWNTALVL